MANYYYFIASLPDIIQDSRKIDITIDEFLNFASEEMDKKSYDNLKKLTIFNDIKNIVEYRNSNFKFTSPSYYNFDTLNENMKDPDTFFSFISEFLFNLKNNKRLYPELNLYDELITIFYNHLSEFCDNNEYLFNYFTMEIDLRNIITAVSSRKFGKKFENKIIKAGNCYDHLIKSTSYDFGLSNEFRYIDTINEIFKEGDIYKIEKSIDDLRWSIYDNLCGGFSFSPEFVYSVFLKLLSVKRWELLSEENGKTRLKELIENIKASIKFPEEFLKIGGKK